MPLSDPPFQRVSSAFRAFLDDLLALDPKQRPKAHKVLLKSTVAAVGWNRVLVTLLVELGEMIQEKIALFWFFHGVESHCWNLPTLLMVKVFSTEKKDTPVFFGKSVVFFSHLCFFKHLLVLGGLTKISFRVTEWFLIKPTGFGFLLNSAMEFHFPH